jgi:hypothetical protein
MFQIAVVGEANPVYPRVSLGEGHLCHAVKGILGIPAVNMLIPDFHTNHTFQTFRRLGAAHLPY